MGSLKKKIKRQKRKIVKDFQKVKSFAVSFKDSDFLEKRKIALNHILYDVLKIPNMIISGFIVVSILVTSFLTITFYSNVKYNDDQLLQDPAIVRVEKIDEEWVTTKDGKKYPLNMVENEVYVSKDNGIYYRDGNKLIISPIDLGVVSKYYVPLILESVIALLYLLASYKKFRVKGLVISIYSLGAFLVVVCFLCYFV